MERQCRGSQSETGGTGASRSQLETISVRDPAPLSRGTGSHLVDLPARDLPVGQAGWTRWSGDGSDRLRRPGDGPVPGARSAPLTLGRCPNPPLALSGDGLRVTLLGQDGPHERSDDHHDHSETEHRIESDYQSHLTLLDRVGLKLFEQVSRRRLWNGNLLVASPKASATIASGGPDTSDHGLITPNELRSACPRRR